MSRSTQPHPRARLAAISGAGVALAVLPLLVGWAHLPEPLATQWGFTGVPTSAMPRLLFLSVLLVGGALPLALTWRRSAPPGAPLRPLALSMVAFTNTLLVVVSLSTSWLNWDRPRWQDAGHLGLGWVLVLVALPSAAAAAGLALGARLAPPVSLSAEPAPDAVPLPPGSPAAWSGTAKNGWMPLVLVLLLGQGAVMNLIMSRAAGASTYLNLAHVLVLIALQCFGKLRLSIDERQLCIRYGYLGWPRQRVLLERVSAARAFELQPMEHGGWGYRGSLRFLRRAAIVVRGGPALGLDIDGGKRLSITVDDAPSAARLLNSVLARRRLDAEGSVNAPS